MAQVRASAATRRLAQSLRAPSPSGVLQPRSVALRRWAPAVAPKPLQMPYAAQQRAFFWSGGGGDGNNKSNKDKKEPVAETASEAAPSDGGSSKAVAEAKAPEQTPEAAAEGSEAGAEDGTSSALPVLASGALRKDVFEPRLMVLPLPKRPLFPFQQQILHISHTGVVKEIRRMEKQGRPPFVGTFLHKSVAAEAPAAEGEGQESEDGETPRQQLESFTGVEDPASSLYHIGTRARILQVLPYATQTKDGIVLDGIQLLLQGVELISLDSVLSRGPPLVAHTSKVEFASDTDPNTTRAYINETMHTIREIMKISPQFREHAAMIHHGLERFEKGDPHAIAHFAASLTTATGPELMKVLETTKPAEKLREALELLKKELDVSQLQAKIASQIEEKVSAHQREFLLREQMKMIKKELGEDKNDGTDKLLEKFKQRLEGKNVPKDALDAIKEEMEKFSNLAKESFEYQMTRNYLDWLTILPWGHNTDDTLNLAKARRILDRDHYGMNEVKERIHELIAVGALKGSVQGKIVCLVGPPGVGKTSIGRSIAEALGREYYRFSVGGLYDVAEIKGHRRTYVGAMPGKVIQALKKVQSSNPLILIDEVDKIGRGHQGDPASALLELLDPSQNSGFLDHYLDVPVDCSRVLFVCTANVTDTIPGPLLDRMEVIRLSGYDSKEKVKIAEDFLVPNSMRDVGLWPPAPPLNEAKEAGKGNDTESGGDAAMATTAIDQSLVPKASIETEALESLIRWYCREAGVRNLQKHVEKICRKLATKLVEHKEARNPDNAVEAAPEVTDIELRVTKDHLKEYVGKPLFLSDRLYEGDMPAGTVTGLAWTSMGGSVLYIEAVALPRSGTSKGSTPSLSVTGQLGSVMKESSQIAMLNARRQAAVVFPDDRKSFFEEHDIHLHCPEGATPKDGPSAGITMTTALVSLALGRPARADLAMTGEVSLNGKVLPVGGIKEKTIAARRAGCKALVFPKANQRDFDELPEYLRDGLEIHFVTLYEDVFRIAFPQES